MLHAHKQQGNNTTIVSGTIIQAGAHKPQQRKQQKQQEQQRFMCEEKRWNRKSEWVQDTRYLSG